ncbi:PIN domain-containing protein [Candidatus Woesearchaeota archaeon]|nr:PIN domain-containing protein [Candidatus Woesearchaeota archaeon]
MDNKIYFFDSYALAEIKIGNPNYKPYLTAKIVLTKLNIFEIYYSILRDTGKKEAEQFLAEYYQFVIDFSQDDIKEAAQLKLEYKKRDLSMTDCIGYVLADRLGIKFLTGDKEFKDFENVEFIK